MREELTAATPLEDAFLRIAYLEDHVRKLTEDLYNVRASFFKKKRKVVSLLSRVQVRDENAQLRRDLEAERLENLNLRQHGGDGAAAGSESRYFSDWYNEQQMTSDL